MGLGSGFPCEVTAGFTDGLLLPLIHFVLLGYLPIAAMLLAVGPRSGQGAGR